MPKLNLICVADCSLVPADDEARAYLYKRFGKSLTGEFREQRSPQHNRLFWAIADKVFENLPEPYASNWATKHAMVKGLEAAYGITDTVMKPTKSGWEIVQIPKSLDFGNMDQDEFNAVSEKLFKGMAHCLGVTVDELLSESRAA